MLSRLAILAALAFLLAGCGGGDDAQTENGHRLEVVASFFPVAEAATRVGGELARVVNLTPVGVEPHDIELTPRQVDRLEDADLVLYLGKEFQSGVEEIAERRDHGRVDLLAEVELAGGDEADHEESGPDPHFWLNPLLMVDAVDAIADALSQMAPAAEEVFRGNAQRYQDELTALDEDFERGLADCDRKEIVTSHAAFSYLAERYGLTQIAIAGVSPEAEPDADRVAALAGEIDAKGITTVFFEQLVSPEVAETLARETGAKTAVLNPLEGLSREDVDAGKDYAAVMRENLAALRDALGCR
jgi:zinc transport system substrate-binding protein